MYRSVFIVAMLCFASIAPAAKPSGSEAIDERIASLRTSLQEALEAERGTFFETLKRDKTEAESRQLRYALAADRVDQLVGALAEAEQFRHRSPAQTQTTVATASEPVPEAVAVEQAKLQALLHRAETAIGRGERDALIREMVMTERRIRHL